MTTVESETKKMAASQSVSAPQAVSAPDAKPGIWSRAALRATDLFRDHADFPLPATLPLFGALSPKSKEGDPQDDSALLTEGGLPGEEMLTVDREAFFNAELARLFCQRLRLVLLAVLIILPWLALISFFNTSSSVWGSVLLCYITLFAVCMATLFIISHKIELWQVRLLSILLYMALCGTAAGIMILVGDHQNLVNSGHTQILLSILIMPYTVLELAIVSMIVAGSYAGALQWALPDGGAATYLPYLGTLTLNILIVFFIGHFQAVLRRIAFERSLDLATAAARSRALSMLDPVTGGYNRRHLEERLEVELLRAARLNYPTSVLMFDLDNFKAVNDQRGHHAGDEVLRQVWRAAVDTLRRTDLVGRYGGDEFICVLPQADVESATLVAERLCNVAGRRLRQRFGEGVPEAGVTLSVGVVTHNPAEPFDTQELIKRADEKLYAAKRQGKNCVIHR